MKIVIDMPEETYKHIMSMQFYIPGSRGGKSLVELMLKTIRSGTPLPKGHGRLIDADELEELFGRMCPSDCGACDPKRKTDGCGRWYDTCSLIDVAPTIIEADKAESEEGRWL